MDGPEGAPDRFLAKLASGDLLIWKKNYFSGRSYAELLRFVEKRKELLTLFNDPHTLVAQGLID
jgi:hypothetical protein